MGMFYGDEPVWKREEIQASIAAQDAHAARQYDPEARYLKLASRPGMESLLQWCGECGGKGWQSGNWVAVGNTAADVAHYEQVPCRGCGGKQKLPLPEAERMGALARVFRDRGDTITLYADDSVLIHGFRRFAARTHQQALTEALLAATEVKA